MTFNVRPQRQQQRTLKTVPNTRTPAPTAHIRRFSGVSRRYHANMLQCRHRGGKKDRVKDREKEKDSSLNVIGSCRRRRRRRPCYRPCRENALLLTVRTISQRLVVSCS